MSRRTPSDTPPDQGKRLARLQAALRANLARRKAQARDRAGGSETATPPAGLGTGPSGHEPADATAASGDGGGGGDGGD